MNLDYKKVGGAAMLVGVLLIGIGIATSSSNSRNSAPVLSQPATGPVNRPSPPAAQAPATTYAATQPSPPAPPPVIYSQPNPVYTPPAPPPPTKAQLLDRNPILTEPTPGLQSRTASANYDAQIKLENHLPAPAYVKVVNDYGTTIATIYLRSQESHELDIHSGTYFVKYATGPASQWRGPVHYFGSGTSFHKGTPDVIGTRQILTLTFYQTRVSGYSATGIPSISEEEFDR